MVVRQTMLVAGVLKQNFCQSPYLISRAMRSPRGPIFISGWSPCCAHAGVTRFGNSGDSATAMEAIEEIDGEVRSFMSFPPPPPAETARCQRDERHRRSSGESAAAPRLPPGWVTASDCLRFEHRAP